MTIRHLEHPGKESTDNWESWHEVMLVNLFGKVKGLPGDPNYRNWRPVRVDDEGFLLIRPDATSNLVLTKTPVSGGETLAANASGTVLSVINSSGALVKLGDDLGDLQQYPNGFTPGNFAAFPFSGSLTLTQISGIVTGVVSLIIRLDS